MFEDRTFENIMAEYLADAGTYPDVDTRQGSIFYDTGASACLRIARTYADLRHVFYLVFLPTAVGEYLDRIGELFRMFRNQATKARYEYIHTGAIPSVGERFFDGAGYYYVLRQNKDNGALYLEAEIPGIICNNVFSTTPAVPMQTIAGLTVSQFGALIEPGADTEEDENFRNRIREKIAGPAENGNRQHYKTWCESIDGVGRARIIPLFAGENTVMAVIIDNDGLPAAQTVCDRVQEYIDPITLNLTANTFGQVYTIGDGVGDGVANIGAHFCAVPALALNVNISFKVELKSGGSLANIQSETEKAVREYLRVLALVTPEKEKAVIRVSAINSILYSLPGLVDYADLEINGLSGNLELDVREVAILQGVTVTAI